MTVSKEFNMKDPLSRVLGISGWGGAAPSHRSDEKVVQKTKSIWERILNWFGLTQPEIGATERLREKIENVRIEKLGEALNIGISTGDRGRKGGPSSYNKSMELSNRWAQFMIDKFKINFYNKRNQFPKLISAKESAIEGYLLDKFTRQVFYLAEQIKLLNEKRENEEAGLKIWPKGLELDTVEKIRNYLNQILENPIYKEFKDEDEDLINLLQIICIKLCKADGRKAFEGYAKDVGLTSNGQHRRAGDLAPIMSDRLSKIWSHKRDTTFQILAWGATHTDEVLHSYHSIRNPLDYNSHTRNPTYVGGKFELGSGQDSRQMDFVWGPGMTGDSIAELGLIPAYKKFGIREIRFNYQDERVSHEAVRIEKVRKISNASGNAIKHVLLGFDTKANHSALRDVENVDGFLRNYRTQLLVVEPPSPTHGVKASGISISRRDLKEDELNQILESAREIFKRMGIDELLAEKPTLWEKLTGAGQKKKENLVKTMLFVLDAMISSAIVYKELKKSKSDKQKDQEIDLDLQTDIVTAACKGALDRGPVQANGLRLFYRALMSDGKSNKLSEKEFSQIAGSTLGRARLVEGRNIMSKRYEVFDSFLRLISGKETSMDKIMRDLRKKLDEVAIKPDREQLSPIIEIESNDLEKIVTLDASETELVRLAAEEISNKLGVERKATLEKLILKAVECKKTGLFILGKPEDFTNQLIDQNVVPKVKMTIKKLEEELFKSWGRNPNLD